GERLILPRFPDELLEGRIIEVEATFLELFGQLPGFCPVLRILQEVFTEEILWLDPHPIQQVLHGGEIAGAKQSLGQQVLGVAAVADATRQHNVRLTLRCLAGNGADAGKQCQACQGGKKSGSKEFETKPHPPTPSPKRRGGE